MHETVYRVMVVLWAVVAAAPVGTNPGLVHLLWRLVSERCWGGRAGDGRR